MKKKVSRVGGIFFGLFFISLAFLSCSQNKSDSTKTNFCQFVDPFIGTDGPGNTYPGASLPFGMVQLSPDNGRSGWDWISGYFYPDTVIAGFSHLHLSGTGAGDLYDISFFAYTGEPKLADHGVLGPEATPYSLFSHENETASPGYYSVELQDYPIKVELTTTNRTGLQKFTFTEAAEAIITLDLSYARNWDWVTDSYLETVLQDQLNGYRKSSGWAKDQRVFFSTRISRKWNSIEILQGEESHKENAHGKKVMAKMHFSVQAGDTILIKTGISSASMKNAELNLDTEQSGFDFNKVRKEAKQAWEDQLGKIRIKTDKDNMKQFYTAMYHSMLGPTLFSDVNGEYKSPDGEIHKALTYSKYATFSLWDTYRAEHPLATILHPNRTIDFINSMLSHYDETGLLPVWELLGNETNMMMGYHAVPVIADAILKNMEGFDYELAYEAMKKSAMQDKNGLKEFRELGYVPYEVRNWNVSLTLEYAFDDWCIAQVAEKLGNNKEQNYYLSRSQNYRNHYDQGSDFMRAKNANGEFKTPFDPNSYHPEDYCEANAWQYNWYVPHDVDGMIDMMGGQAKFVEHLEAMFTSEQKVSETSVWISGYFGQYVHGNEPSHHVPYLFRQAGNPERTEYWVRRIMDEMYTTEPDGLCGNEDFGQMSAWYVFSAMGFYPVNPAGGLYILGSPQLDEAVLKLPNGKEFRISTLNQSPDNVHVRTVTLNGEKLIRNYITHQEILEGGEMIFELEK